MKITIPGTLPSLNEMINASKRNKYEYVKMKDAAIKSVGWSAKQAMREEAISRTTFKCDFEITWFCPNMRKDKDNIMAGQKFIFDGLQEVGFINNDGWKQIRNVTHKFEVDKHNPRVVVEIYEVAA